MSGPVKITAKMIEAGILVAKRQFGGDVHQQVINIYREMQAADETGKPQRAAAIPAHHPSAATPRQFHGTVDGSGCDL